MSSRDDVSRYLPGVADIIVNALVGPGNAGPDARTQRVFSRRNLQVVVPCTAGCRGGGYDLAQDLHDRFVSRNRTEGQGVIRCRGYHDMGRGRRKACDHTLAYGTRVTYGVNARYER